MGIVCDGAYADDVHHDAFHEGYAGRLWPDGTLGATWGSEYGWTGHSGLVGACDCGWRSDRIHPPGDYDGPEHEAAERDFETQHLQPLIEEARQRSWPQWSRRVAALADQIADLAHRGRLDNARDILDSLGETVLRRGAVLAELDLEQQAADERAPAAAPFGPIGAQLQPLPRDNAPQPAPPPRHPQAR